MILCMCGERRGAEKDKGMGKGKGKEKKRRKRRLRLLELYVLRQAITHSQEHPVLYLFVFLFVF